MGVWALQADVKLEFSFVLEKALFRREGTRMRL